MSAPCIHHIGIGVPVCNIKPVLDLFRGKLGFDAIATRVTNFDQKWVMRKGEVVFVITTVKSQLQPLQELEAVGCVPENHHVDVHDFCNPEDAHFSFNGCLGAVSHGECFVDDYASSDNVANGIKSLLLPFAVQPEHDLPDFSSAWSFPCTCRSLSMKCSKSSAGSLKHSVYEICMKVADVQKSIERALACGAYVTRPLTKIKNCHGEVTYATIRSCVGNVQHTIINTDNYQGSFLPGFEDCEYEKVDDTNNFIEAINLDHITLCVERGKALETISWYEDCFQMRRLLVNK